MKGIIQIFRWVNEKASQEHSVLSRPYKEKSKALHLQKKEKGKKSQYRLSSSSAERPGSFSGQELDWKSSVWLCGNKGQHRLRCVRERIESSRGKWGFPLLTCHLWSPISNLVSSTDPQKSRQVSANWKKSSSCTG